MPGPHQHLLFFYRLAINYCTGGYLANSLAVMTDAAHMLTDVTSFGIALLAIALGKQKPSKHLNYGWQRTGKF